MAGCEPTFSGSTAGWWCPWTGPAPAVATLMPGVRSAGPPGPAGGGRPRRSASARSDPLPRPRRARPRPGSRLLALIRPDPATMDLADATRVLGGGAGLVARGGADEQARAVFALLVRVAAALGASAGATRVVTDAGWTGSRRARSARPA